MKATTHSAEGGCTPSYGACTGWLHLLPSWPNLCYSDDLVPLDEVKRKSCRDTAQPQTNLHRAGGEQPPSPLTQLQPLFQQTANKAGASVQPKIGTEQ